MQNN
ncbi:Cyclin-dependent kinase 14, partial [Araneus ventricosus]|jgi:hypothetical protein